MYRPLWSACILKEAVNGLKKLGYTAEQQNKRIKAMQAAFPEAVVDVPHDMCGGLTGIPDEHDRHVLAAAILGPAHVIVTQNKKHFPTEYLDRFHILRHTPDEFLVHQFHLNPEAILEKLDAQASARHEERPAIIKRLKVMTPEFCTLIEQWDT